MEKYVCFRIEWVLTLGICTFATEIYVQQQVIQIVNVNSVGLANYKIYLELF
jgi:hypothetical protein